jgi:ligand-binding sensor domain-containing protein
MAQDAEGVLWLGTLDGLASFDGQTMEDAGSAPGAPAFGGVYALATRAGGGLYVGGTAGLHERTPQGRWHDLSAGRAIGSVVEDEPGVVWAVDQQGKVRRYVAGPPARWDEVSLPGGGAALAVARGQRGVVWVLTSQQLFRIDGGGPVRVADSGATRFGALCVTRGGDPWVGAVDGSLTVVDATTRAARPVAGCDEGRAVTALIEDTRGRIWAGCANGHVSFGPPAGPRVEWGSEQGLYLDARVLSFAEDRHGAIWLGRNGAGALQLVSEQWRHRTRWSGQSVESREPVFDITPLQAGGALVAVFNRGLWYWDGQRVVEIGRERGLTENTRAVAVPRDGVIWVGGRFGLYESVRNGRFTRVLTLPTGFVTGLRRSPDGSWYALTSTDGLWQYLDGAWHRLSALNERLPHLAVRDITWLANGEMWLATGAGAARIAGDTVHPLNGIGEPGAFLANAILELPDGDIWLAGMGGLWIRHGTTWRHLTAKDGIPGRTVYSLRLGPDGSVWAGGAEGVGRYVSGRWELFNRHSGLMEDECTLAGLAVLPDGRVLVGTMGSLAVFDPSVARPMSPPLALYWRDTPPRAADGTARLEEGVRRARVRYSAPWLTGEPIEYRTRVTPGQTAFSSPTSLTELELPRMDAGRSIVEVQARIAGTSDEAWITPLALKIDVPPRLYETWWASLLGLVALLGLFQLGVRLRTRRLRRHELELQRAVDDAVADVKTLRGLIPICASCKRIRDDHGSWNQLETYLRAHSDAMLSHGICPECMKTLYPDYTDGDTAGPN